MSSPCRWRIGLSFLVTAVVLLIGPAAGAEGTLDAGVARIDISPTKPVPLMGYAARAKLPMTAEVAQPIHARALALGTGPATALLITIDNCILPRAFAADVRRRLCEKLALRPECIAFSVTHTHSAPCLSGAAPNIFGQEMSAEMLAAIDEYTAFLGDRLEQVSKAAMDDRKPANLAWGKGTVAFAKNRRTPGGPVDHEMPLLKITGTDGKARGLWLSYACHCTTLGGNLNAVHGDWAGVAAQAIEQETPGVVALVSVGCGADSNPDPRGTVELVEQHGKEVAREVNRLMVTDLIEISTLPNCRLEEIQLPYQLHFSPEQWQKRAAEPGIVGYHARKWLARMEAGEGLPGTLPYPVQTWVFGDELASVFLGGEVVVDYSLRLKRELSPDKLWINAYSNDVPCYIPSVRILQEGGYEAETSLWYYDRPQRLAPETEELIVQAVRRNLPESFRAGR
jgi:hypothetical protein